MDLSEKSAANMAYMVQEITSKLKMVNAQALHASRFNTESYDDLHDLYEMVIKKNAFSPNEMQAIVEELGHLKKD
ncbi:DUF1128 domain-containing protein [Heyndrickxia acidiproducens]|uniref:DUF1128 domain-containing protein n=1 Tax=Heyndrickxia acidiproducens TaxID=1121084 RepID=UPI000476F37F|nr:DUF1128 domain-containing protein [Heyndrickxia acidiproducens]